MRKLCHDQLGVSQQSIAIFSRHNAAIGALEKQDSGGGFCLFERLSDRGLGHIKIGGGTDKAFCLADGYDGTQMPQSEPR